MTEVRTPVPARRYAQGYVVPATLERRAGPGEEYPSYAVPLKHGDTVVVMDCISDGHGNLWAMIGPDVWAAATWGGKVYISGEVCE